MILQKLFVTLTWLVGIAGVGGAISIAAALVLLGPTAVVTIVRPLLVRYLSCIWCIVATASVLSTIAAYWVGHHSAVNACNLEKMNSKIAAAEADARAERSAKEDEARRANKIQEEADDQRKKDLEYIAALKERKGCGFDSGSDDDNGNSRALPNWMRAPGLHAPGKKSP